MMNLWLVKRRIPDSATASTKASRGRSRFFIAALLGLFIGLPATSHQALAHSATDASATDTPADIVTGTVVGVVIEDRVKNATFTYRQLQLDDGTAIPLQGAPAETLQVGAYVRMAGKRL